MKKIIFFLMAVMAMFTSCSSDEVVENASKDIKFDFTFDKEDENGTRALKSSWENGDKVYIMFQNQYSGYLLCTYNGTKWTTKTEGKLTLSEDETDKRLIALWVAGNPDSSALHGITSGSKNAYLDWGGVPDWMSTDAVEYTYDASSSTVSANLIFAMKYSNFTKITITGLDKNKEWTLSSPSLLRRSYLTLEISSGRKPNAYFAGAGGYNETINGIKAVDGICFIGSGDNKESGNTSFTLVDLKDGKTYTKTFTGKTLSAKKAFKFDGPTSTTVLNGWKQDY